MPLATRVGDMTSHGTSFGPWPGGSSVLIGGMPAWRAKGDTHACPLVTGSVPHATGMVAMGSTTVMIGGTSAAMQGDSIVEVGHLNTISKGCPMVNIG